jgi:hypothetical protein
MPLSAFFLDVVLAWATIVVVLVTANAAVRYVEHVRKEGEQLPKLLAEDA